MTLCCSFHSRQASLSHFQQHLTVPASHRLPVDHVPTSLREYPPSQATFGYTWRSGCSCHKDGALRSMQLCCVWTVHMELARPVINPNILLSPTEDLPLRQSTYNYSTLVNVFSVRADEHNITTVHTYIHRRRPATTRRTLSSPFQHSA